MIQMSQDKLAHISTTIHKLKGSPFTLLIALAVCGGPMNNQEFQLVTGYSAGTVTSALKKLTLHRMVVNTGKSGWVLSDGMHQLPLFTEAMLDPGKKVLIDEGKTQEDRKIYDLPPSSSSLRSINNSKPKEEEERNPPEHRKIYDHQAQPVDNPVDNSEKATIKQLLIKAGIGSNSPKLREILAQGHDAGYIHAHTRYYLWWREQRRRDPRAKTIDGRRRFTVGTLITRILDGDKAPPLRCIDCGREEANCLCHIIQH